MADADKNILVTPAVGSTSEPAIVFTGKDNNPVTLRVIDDGTLSFEGSSGQLFSITDSLTGTIFSVNDISGIPSLEVEDNGTVSIAEFAGNVGVGTASPSTKLHVAGTASFDDNVGFGTSTPAYNLDIVGTGMKIIGVGATAGGNLLMQPSTGNMFNITSSYLTIDASVSLKLEGRYVDISAGPTIGHAYVNVKTSNGTALYITGSNTNRRIAIGNNTTTTLATAQAVIYSSASTYSPLVLRGAASQTASLQEWQDSSGTVLSSISASGVTTSEGNLVGSSGIYFTALTTTGINSTANGENLNFYTRNLIPLSLNGTSAGGAAVNISSAHPSGNAEMLRVNISSATAKGEVIKGAASQTANLQEWQDSSGTVLASISAAGNLALSGTVDGRDISADGTKLDGIAAGAEANAVDSVNSQTGVVVLDADDISDTSTTNKFTTSADITKLAGIESGATADQTAADIRGLGFFDTSNDGTGSGLDADLLDGNHASAFATAAQGSTADSALQNVVEDATPHLGGALDVNGHEIIGAIDLHSTGDIINELGDAAGVNKLSIRDSTATEVAAFDSDGNLIFGSHPYTPGIYHSNSSWIAIRTNGETSFTNNNSDTGLAYYSAYLPAGATIQSRSFAYNALVVKGASTQTANLQEWRNFSGTTLSSVSPSGDFDISGLTVDTTTLHVDTTNNRVGIGTTTPATELDITGSITVSGTVDGRDVAADGTKLDGIAAGAEVNAVDSVNTQTGAVVLDADDISDTLTTNKFTTAAEISKLAGIETGATADQTAADIRGLGFFDTTNDGTGSGLDADLLDGNHASAFATAAQGSTADSALQNVVEDTTPQLGGALDVNGKEITGAIDLHSTGDIITELGDALGVNKLSVRDSAAVEVASIDSDGNFSLSGTVDGRDVAADGTKLDGIAAGAEVNAVDSVNTQTGAVVLDADDISDTSTTNKFTTAANNTKLGHISVTQAVDLDAIETRVNQLDAAVVLQGSWDASAGSFPGSGSAQAGDSYIVSVAGTVNSVAFSVNDRLLAIVDNASTTTYASNWLKLDYTDQVLSVNSQTGSVVLDADDISDASTTNKFTTAADITKLAGIETGATADQTAADIRGLGFFDTSNDGAGSGLDADLLDGNHASAFATAAQGSTADSALQNVVEDTTPQLGGALDVNGKEITGAIDLHSTGDIVNELGDALGVNKLSVRDSAAVEVAAFDSDGNLTLSGTVDGRDVATDGSKLDGIESGATADQTAADIRSLGFFDATNDGTGSGLDADLLDGNHASAFATAAQGSTADSALQNVVEDTTPQLGGSLDVNGQEITGAIDLHSTGDIVNELGDALGVNKLSVRDSAAVEVASIDSDGNFSLSGTVDGRDVATDGTKLDGIAAGAEVNAVDSVNSQTGAVVLDADDISDTSTTNKFTTAADISKLAGIESGATADQTAADIRGLGFFDTTNDGTGSGLDADLLDGNHATAFATAAQGSTADSALQNVVEDTTPQLGGALDVNGQEITGAIDLHSTGDIINELGDAAGINKLSIRDSAAVEVAAFDSDGNLTLAGTVDGRDIAADGTKLDGIESGATADQTAADIRGLGFFDTSNDGTGSGLDADLLDGNHASAFATAAQGSTADSALQNVVEDTTPQLGGSLDVNGQEITGAIDLHSTGDVIAELGDAAGVNKLSVRDSAAVEVAAFDSDGNLILSGTVDGRDVATDGTKLDGIAAGAEVNTVDSVNSQTGAVVLDADDISDAATTNKFTTAANLTKLGHITVTQAVDLDTIESRVNQLDAAVVLQGSWDASVGSFPGSGSAQAGDSYIVSVAGTVNSVAFSVNDRLLAIVDNASTTTYASNWLKLDYTDQVLSVNTQTGAVVLDADDISDTSTTNKFTTAADISKLAGIESGATADQTAADIRGLGFFDTTNDGTGSGLDADLLDGNHASAFATAAQGSTADSALQNVVEDTTPQLGGALDVNGQEITGAIDLHSTGDVIIELGDAAGVNKVSVRDSGAVEQFLIDSDGNVGVGKTPNSGSRLDVNGRIEAYQNTLQTNNDDYAFITSGNFGGGYGFYEGTNRAVIVAPGGNQMEFFVGGSPTSWGTMAIDIDSSGNVKFPVSIQDSTGRDISDAVTSTDVTDIVEISQSSYDALGAGRPANRLYLITS